MGFIDVARDTLKEIPMADILRERLSLAIDRMAESEAKVEALQTEKGSLQAQLEIERLNHGKTQQELQRLKDEHSEDIRFHSGIEFRRGKRTGGKWMASCPKCHIPAVERSDGGYLFCHGGCGWAGVALPNRLAFVISQVEGGR